MWVVLGLNLAVHSPALEVAFAAAVKRARPPSTLAGLEIGNEPDLYGRQPWRVRQRISTTEPAPPHNWTQAYTPADYRADYESYAWALCASLGPISLEAPDTTTPAMAWLDAAPASERWIPRSSPPTVTLYRLKAARVA